MIFHFITSSKDLRNLLLFLLFIGFVNSLFSVREFLTQGSERIGSIVGNVNDLAMIINPLIPIAYFLFSERKMPLPVRVFGVVCMPLISFCTVLTLSRGGAIGLACVWLLLMAKNIKKKSTIFIAVMLILTFVLFVPSTFWERMNTISLDPTEGSASMRKKINLRGLELFSENFLIGVGIGNFRYEILPYFPELNWRNIASHNMYLEIAAETGIIGIGLFLAIIFYALNTGHKLGKLLQKKEDYLLSNLPPYLAIGLVGYLIPGFFLAEAGNPFLWTYLALPMVLKNVIIQENIVEVESESEIEDSRDSI